VFNGTTCGARATNGIGPFIQGRFAIGAVDG
jgi:hypothetical protein